MLAPVQLIQLTRGTANLQEPPTGATVSTAYDTKTAVATLTFANIQMAPDGTYGLREWGRVDGFLDTAIMPGLPLPASGCSSLAVALQCKRKAAPVAWVPLFTVLLFDAVRCPKSVPTQLPHAASLLQRSSGTGRVQCQATAAFC